MHFLFNDDAPAEVMEGVALSKRLAAEILGKKG